MFSGAKADGVFGDCIMIKEGTTVREFAGIVSPEIEKNYQYAEVVGNLRVSVAGDDLLYSKLHHNTINS